MYKFIFLFVYALLFSGNVISQSNSKRVPFYLSYSVRGITKNLCKNQENDSLKVRAIYTWITNNISYDLKAFLRYSEKTYTPHQILRRRKVICSGYSDLFMSMCLHAGIKCMRVEGYEKGFQYIPGSKFYWEEHVWNAVELNGKWHLLDVTWGSGGLKVKKRKFRKFLFETIGVPYLINKLKFKRFPNDRHYCSSPDDMLIDHLPSNPLYQLKQFPLTMGSFESTDTIFYSKGFLDFDRMLDSIKNRSTWDLKIIDAQMAKAFNYKNNRVVGNNYSAYGIYLLRSLPPSLKVNPGSQNVTCNSAAKYLSEALPALNKYKTDNGIVHKIRMDSIEIRNKLITVHVKEAMKANDRIAAGNVLSLNRVNKRIQGYQESIFKLQNQYVKLTSDNLEKINNNNNIKEFKPDLIKKWKEEIDLNNAKIKLLYDTALGKSESIKSFIDSMVIISGMANHTYFLNHRIVEENIDCNIKNEKTSVLKVNCQAYSMNKKSRDQFLAKQNSEVLNLLGKEQKDRFLILNQILTMLSENKKKILLIKKMSIKEGEEDQFYFNENNRLLEVYSKTLAYYRERTKLDEIEYNRMLKELALIKKENKLLRKELKVQAMRYKMDCRRENYRFKLFNTRADRRIKVCKQAIESGKRRLSILKKLGE